jgi:hypothetical protein
MSGVLRPGMTEALVTACGYTQLRRHVAIVEVMTVEIAFAVVLEAAERTGCRRFDLGPERGGMSQKIVVSLELSGSRRRHRRRRVS